MALSVVAVGTGLGLSYLTLILHKIQYSNCLRSMVSFQSGVGNTQ